MVTQWAKGSRCPWRLLDKIEEICLLIKDLNMIIFHVPRSANGLVDEMVKLGAQLSEEVLQVLGELVFVLAGLVEDFLCSGLYIIVCF